MMDFLEEAMRSRKVCLDKLESYGFTKENNGYVLKKALYQSGLQLVVRVSETGRLRTVIVDPESQEPYTLHLSIHASGPYVKTVREEYEAALQSILLACTSSSPYEAAQTLELIGSIREIYSCEPEFLWKSSPSSSIFRREDTRKWFGVLMVIPLNKLGLKSKEEAEVLDLRFPADQIENALDHRKIFPGWHMNKKHWISIVLDGSLSTEEILELVQQSYELAR